MLAAALVFFGVAGLVMGVYFGAMWLFSSLEGRKLARRLREVGGILTPLTPHWSWTGRRGRFQGSTTSSTGPLPDPACRG